MPLIERSADLAVVGANGGGWAVDLGAPVPTAPTDFSLPTAPWHALGAISDDGLKYGFDEDHAQFIPWGLSAPFRTEVTKSIRTFDVKLWETNRAICKSVMFRQPLNQFTPSNAGIFSFAETATPTPDRRSWLFDVYDGATMERFFIPQGEVTDRTDVTFKRTEMAAYEIKMTAYPDTTGNSVYHLYSVAVSGIAGEVGS